MATISGLSLSDAYWYSANWNQFLGAILNGGGASSDNLDLKGFRYTNANEDATTQPYVDVSVSNFSTRFGNSPSRSFHFILNDLQVPSNAVETVLYMSGTNWSTSNVMTIDDRYGLGFLYLWNAPTMHFNVLYRTDDNTIHEYCFRDGVEYTNSAPVLYYIPGVQNSLTYGLGDDGDVTHYVPKNSNGYSWEISGEPTKSVKTSFKCSHKSFLSRDDAYNYLKYGIDNSLNEEEGAGEEEEEEHPTSSGIYVYDVNKFIYTDYAMQNNREQIHSRLEIEFTNFPTDIYDASTHFEPIVCYVDDNNYDNSVQFKIHSGFEEYITNCSIRIGNIETPITNPITAVEGLNSFGYGMGFNSSVDGYVKYMVHTNITIIGADGTALPPTNQLGSDVMIGSTNNANFDVGLSECWILSEHNMKKLARCFNTTVNKLADNSGGYIVAEWLLGLASYSNPLDVVCDLFYLPIDVSDYTDVDNGHFNFTPTLTEIEDSE